MVKEAEENAEADKLVRENVEAKNQLESFLYSVRTSVQDTLKDKISESDKEKVNSAVNQALSWLEEHPAESKAVYEDKRKEVEAFSSPINSAAYTKEAAAGARGESSSSSADAAADVPPNPDEGSSSSGPTVEEVD